MSGHGGQFAQEAIGDASGHRRRLSPSNSRSPRSPGPRTGDPDLAVAKLGEGALHGEDAGRRADRCPDEFGDRIVAPQGGRLRPGGGGRMHRGGRFHWPRRSRGGCGGRGGRADIGHLRPCRISEKWRRMRARLQENRVDDDHEAGSTGAEDRQRVDRTVGNFRPKAKADRGGGTDGAGCGSAPVFVAAVTHFSLPACRHSRRDPRPPTRRLPAGPPRPSASGPAHGHPLRWRSARKASCPASPARNRGACAR